MEMREGNLWKSIMLFSLPLMLTNLLQLFFNIADVAIVGRFAGPLSLGAVGSTSLLIALTTGWFIGIANGVNSVVAFFIGSGDGENVKRSGDTGFFLCLASGLITMAAGLCFAKPVLRLLGTKPELIDEAILYFRLYMLGSPALAVFNYGNSVLSSEGNTKKPLNYLMLAGVINVILNLLFVIVFKMTAEGVALASIISQYVSALLILRALIHPAEGEYRFSPRALRPDGALALKILRIGIPAAVQYSLFSVANLFVQSAVNTFDHTVVEGNSAAMNYDAVVYDMMAAFYTACTSFTAQNYGAGIKERVRKTYLITTVYSFSLAAVLGAVIHLFRLPLMYVFTAEASVASAGAVRLGILSVCYCISAFMDNATAACRGLGSTAVPTVIILFGSIVFRIVWIYTVFAHFGTLFSLYTLYGCAFAITSVFGNIYYFLLYRKTFRSEGC